MGERSKVAWIARFCPDSIAVIVAASLACCIPGCISAEPSLEIGGGVFTPELGGSLQIGPPGGVKTDADFGLDDTALVPYFEARGGWRALNGSVSGFNADFGGSATTTTAIGAIPAGTPADSEFRSGAWKATVTGNVADLGPVRVAAGIGVVRLDFDLAVQAIATGVTENLSSTANVPVLAVYAWMELERFRLRASLAGITGDFGDSEGTLLDAEFRVGFEVLSGRELFLAYHYLQDELGGVSKGQEFDFEMRQQGLLFGVELRF